MVYKTDFLCTYNLILDEELTSVLYQVQLLQAFDMKDFDEEKMNKETQLLFERFKDNIYIKELLQLIDIGISFDELTQFRFLFKYDTFHLFHRLLIDLIGEKDVNIDNFSKLKKLV